MNKRKLLTLALTLSLVAILAVGGTLAYFTDTDDAINTFTVGNVDIELTEPSWNTGNEEVEDVYPGEPLPKDPIVTNIGANPCFVRVSVTGLDSLMPAGMITYRTNYVEGALGENWVLHTDGYFYYTKVLAKEEATSKLFDQIVMPAGLTNGYDGSYSVVVTAEAVQAQGAKPSFSAVQAMGVEEIAAWFATCMA